MRRFLYMLTLGGYWLALGMWVGVIVMGVVAVTIIFKTVPEYEPAVGVAPYTNELFSEPKTQQTIIAGGVARHVLRGMRACEFVCGVTVLICLLLQCTAFAAATWPAATKRLGLRGGWWNWLRIALIVIPLLNIGAQQNIAKRLSELRQVRYDPQVDDEQRARAQFEFDQLHERSVRMTAGSLFMLLGAGLVSCFLVTPAPRRREFAFRGDDG